MENLEKKQFPADISQKIIEKLKHILYSVSDNEIIEIQDKIVAFDKHLKTVYPNATQFNVLHALIGSTPNKDDPAMIFEDFPGEDSIEKFVNAIEAEYLK